MSTEKEETMVNIEIMGKMEIMGEMGKIIGKIMRKCRFGEEWAREKQQGSLCGCSGIVLAMDSTKKGRMIVIIILLR